MSHNTVLNVIGGLVSLLGAFAIIVMWIDVNRRKSRVTPKVDPIFMPCVPVSYEIQLDCGDRMRVNKKEMDRFMAMSSIGKAQWLKGNFSGIPPVRRCKRKRGVKP